MELTLFSLLVLPYAALPYLPPAAAAVMQQHAELYTHGRIEEHSAELQAAVTAAPQALWGTVDLQQWVQLTPGRGSSTFPGHVEHFEHLYALPRPVSFLTFHPPPQDHKNYSI